MIDWKRSDKDSDLPSKFLFQLNLYKLMLESGRYRLQNGMLPRIKKMYVIQLHPDLPEGAKVISVQDIDREELLSLARP